MSSKIAAHGLQIQYIALISNGIHSVILLNAKYWIFDILHCSRWGLSKISENEVRSTQAGSSVPVVWGPSKISII